MPHIPSLPISYLDAFPLLKALNGHVPKASTLDAHWHGGGLDYMGVEYNVGPSPDHLVLNLVNEEGHEDSKTTKASRGKPKSFVFFVTSCSSVNARGPRRQCGEGC